MQALGAGRVARLMVERLRGRRGVAQRTRRLQTEPLCRQCAERGRVTEATVPDHIIPLAKGGTDEDSNVRCLCAACHDEVTRQEFGHRRVTPIGVDGWPTED